MAIKGSVMVVVVEQRWLDMTLQEQRELIAQVIDCVIVRRAAQREQRSHAESRIVVCPAAPGHARPLPGPAPPRCNRRVRQRAWISPSKTAIRRRWTDRRLARELQPVLERRTSWPSRAEFHAVGAGRVHRASGPGRGQHGRGSRVQPADERNALDLRRHNACAAPSR
jgi:hypothetical protein